jgi:cytochrome c554/c'-like protein
VNPGELIVICLLSLVLPIVFGAAPQVPRASATNQCAACHLKLVWTTSAITHVDQWVTSRHALYGVGCEKCHGGDGRTPDATAAHRGVIHSIDPSSAVNATALPATCGRCHRPEADAFAQSTHRTLLVRGDQRAPTCTSCHTSMAADLPVSGNVEHLCMTCHRDNGEPDRTRRARRQLEEVARQRRMLERARLEIAALSDAARRTPLMTDWTAADVSLRSVVARIHSFDQAGVDVRIADSRR